MKKKCEAAMSFRSATSERSCWGLSIAMGVLVSGVSLGAEAYAYQEVSVTDGGTLAGTVKLQGKKTVPRGFNLVTFPDPIYCGRISNGSRSEERRVGKECRL